MEGKAGKHEKTALLLPNLPAFGLGLGEKPMKGRALSTPGTGFEKLSSLKSYEKFR